MSRSNSARVREHRKRYRAILYGSENGSPSALSVRDWQGLWGEWAVELALHELGIDYESHFTVDQWGDFDAGAWKDFTGQNPDAKILQVRNKLLEVKNNSDGYNID